MGLTVYGSYISPPCRSVYIFCKVNGIPFTDTFVDLSKGEHREEAFLKINAIGKVPCIADDGFDLTECITIIKYLAAKHKVDDHWYPAELKAQAKVNEYLDWHHTGLRKSDVAIFYEQVLSQKVYGKPTDEAELTKDYQNFDEVLGLMERKFLGDGAFLCGDEISIADICALTELMQVVSIQRTDVLASHPKLAAWKDRVIERLNPAYEEVHKIQFEFAASVTSKK